MESKAIKTLINSSHDSNCIEIDALINCFLHVPKLNLKVQTNNIKRWNLKNASNSGSNWKLMIVLLHFGWSHWLTIELRHSAAQASRLFAELISEMQVDIMARDINSPRSKSPKICSTWLILANIWSDNVGHSRTTKDCTYWHRRPASLTNDQIKVPQLSEGTAMEPQMELHESSSGENIFVYDEVTEVEAEWKIDLC